MSVRREAVPGAHGGDGDLAERWEEISTCFCGYFLVAGEYHLWCVIPLQRKNIK